MEMREILFRGKRVDNGEWVKGIPVETEADCGIRIFIITYAKWDSDDNSIDFLETVVYEVEPETVGQFTGLTDKNGVKIFEGDIVKEYKTKDKVKGVVKFGEYQSGINKYADDLGFYVEWTTENFLIRELGYWCRKNMLEVIGNIHDGVKSND